MDIQDRQDCERFTTRSAGGAENTEGSAWRLTQAGHRLALAVCEREAEEPEAIRGIGCR